MRLAVSLVSLPSPSLDALAEVAEVMLPIGKGAAALTNSAQPINLQSIIDERID